MCFLGGLFGYFWVGFFGWIFYCQPCSEVRLVWQVAGPATFLHTVRLSQAAGPLSEALHIENLFDLGPDPGLRDRELFMQLDSGVAAGGALGGFYTDQTGLGFAQRFWAQEVDIEG